MEDFNKCVNDIFQKEDFKNIIKKNDIKNHNHIENAWITLDNNVYSIKNNDDDLLNIFKDFYGKDIKKYLLENFDNKERILLLEKLKKRKIGIIK